ncbi:MAG: glycosyltransferase family 2 protein [Nanoarchaeota archaeon]
MKEKLVATIPAYNEESKIGEVVKGCFKYCKEVVVIDDGSKDATAKVAKKAGAKVFRNNPNMGVGYTVRRCYEEALKLNPDIIVNLDGDGQHNPDEIPAMIAPLLKENIDFVIGSRRLGKNAETSFIRNYGNKYFSFLISLMIKQRITDSQSGYRAIKADKLKKLDLREKYTNRQEMIVLARKKGIKMKEIPIFVEKRGHGKSFIGNFRKKLYFLTKVTFIIFKTRFLR